MTGKGREDGENVETTFPASTCKFMGIGAQVLAQQYLYITLSLNIDSYVSIAVSFTKMWYVSKVSKAQRVDRYRSIR